MAMERAHTSTSAASAQRGTAQHGTLRSERQPASGPPDGQPLPLAPAPFPGSSGASILLVDADAAENQLLAADLERQGHRVRLVESGEAALGELDRADYDLVLLEAVLPGMSGFDAGRQIRARSDVPLMFATERSALADRLGGFDVGADDYVVKPIDPLELDRRVRAVVRRSGGRPTDIRRRLSGPRGLLVDVGAHRATAEGLPLDLTPKEFGLLRLFLERQDGCSVQTCSPGRSGGTRPSDRATLWRRISHGCARSWPRPGSRT